MGLPSNFGIARNDKDTGETGKAAGVRTAILAGSCSAITRQQLVRARTLWPNLQIDVDAIAEGRDVVGEAISWARGQTAMRTAVQN
ncbi:nucleotide-binding domain containing protein [Brucella sp. BE17]|uniref:nucleotide-binding domain containing protein n=1 Tax=Brucella sp. BE17 TaxID=3142977 RepID=UPI0031BBB290